MLSLRPRRTGNRNVPLFLGISLFSGFAGTAMRLVSGVWVLDLTGSSSLAALIGTCIFAPTLLGPVLGAIVDRLPRRPLLVATHLGTAAAVLALLTVRSEAGVWLIFAVMVGYGVSFVLIDAGEAAILPAALPPEELGATNGLRMSAQEGVKLVAPAVGAGLFAWGGGHPVVAVTAALLLVAAGLYPLLRLDRAPVAPAVPRSDTSDPSGGRYRIRDGIRYLRDVPELRLTVLLGSVAIAMSGLSTAGLYSVVTEDLHRPAAFLGVLTSAQGAGSILGGLLVGRLLRAHGTVAVGALGALLFALGVVGYGAAPWWPLTVASALVVGLGLPWTLVAAMTAVQTRTPDRLLGRVSATANTLLFTPVAIATPAGAAMVLLDHRLPLAVSATCATVAAILTIRAQRRARGSAHPGSRGPADRSTPERPTERVA
jgi:MFS family permease